jgi:Helix-turn-helix domain
MSRNPDPILPTLEGLRKLPAQPTRLPLDLHPVRIAAAITKMHVKSIYRLMRAGKVRCFGRRGCYRVSVSDLLPVVEFGGREKPE